MKKVILTVVIAGLVIFSASASLLLYKSEKRVEKLEGKIQHLVEPVLFYAEGKKFVSIRRIEEFNDALLSVNNSLPVPIQNYVSDEFPFAGVFKLPNDINSNDEVIIYVPKEGYLDGMSPVKIPANKFTLDEGIRKLQKLSTRSRRNRYRKECAPRRTYDNGFE